jgi:hypothetical protein
MRRETKRAILIVVAVLVSLVVLAVGTTIVFFVRAADVDTVDPSRADDVWRDIRGRFPGAQPLLAMSDHQTAVLTREPPPTPGGRLESLHIAAWNPRESNLFQMTLPFWMVRLLRSGTINIGDDAGNRRLEVTVEQLEQFGPSLVLDHEAPDGERVLVWTD